MGEKKKKQIPPEEVEKLLKRLYLSGWTAAQIARRVCLPVAEVERRLPEVEQSLKSIYKMLWGGTTMRKGKIIIEVEHKNVKWTVSGNMTFEENAEIMKEALAELAEGEASKELKEAKAPGGWGYCVSGML